MGAGQAAIPMSPNAGGLSLHKSMMGVRHDVCGDKATPETIMPLSCCASNADADALSGGADEMPPDSKRSSNSSATSFGGVLGAASGALSATPSRREISSSFSA